MATDKSRDEVWKEWRELVNMSPSELEEWLDTEESRSVGDNDSGNGSGNDSGESTGHRSGRRIVDIQRTRKDELSDSQWSHMAKVVGYVKRHCAQGGPGDDVEHSAWRYSLMNWGHDPLADDGCR